MKETLQKHKPTLQNKIWTENYLKMCMTTFFFWCCSQILVPVLPLYVMQLGTDSKLIGLTNASFTFTALALRPFVGKECDRLDRKNVLMAGLLFLILSCLGQLFAASFLLIIFLNVFRGVGWSASSTASNTIIADLVPPQRRGEGIGYYGMFGTLTMALGPLVGLSLYEKHGFTTVVAVCLSFAVIAFCTGTSLKLEKYVPQPTAAEKSGLFEKRALKSALLMGILSFTFSGLSNYLPLAARQREISNVGLFFTCNALAIMAVRLKVGKYYDAKGPHHIIIASLLCLLTAAVLVAFSNSLGILLISGLICGFGFGCLQPTLLALSVKGIEPQRRGAVNGTVMGAYDFGAGLGAIFLGLVMSYWGFKAMYLISALAPVTGLSLYYLYWQRKN